MKEGNITTDLIEITGLVLREYYANKLDTLHEIDTFLERYKLTQ